MAHYINRDRNHKPLYGDPFQAIYDWVGWTDRYPAISESVLKNPTSILPTRSQVETAAMGASAVGMAAMATGALPLAASLAVAGGITATALTLSNTQATATLPTRTPVVPSGARPLALPAPVGWSDKEVDHEEEQKEAIKQFEERAISRAKWAATGTAVGIGLVGLGLAMHHQSNPKYTFKAAQSVAEGARPKQIGPPPIDLNKQSSPNQAPVVDLRNIPSTFLGKQYSKDKLDTGPPSDSGETVIRVTSPTVPATLPPPVIPALGSGTAAIASAAEFERGSAAAQAVNNAVGMVSYRDPFGADTLPSNAPPKPVPHTPQQTQTYRNVNQSSATQSARHSKYYEPNVGYRPPIGDHGNVNLADVMRVIVSAPGAPGGDDPTATDFDWCCIGKAATAAAATALII